LEGTAGGMGVMGRLSDEQLAAWVAASCHAQGVAVKVSDPRTVEQVRVLMTGQAGRTAPARQRRRGVTAGRSEAPDWADPVRIEGLHSGRPRADDGVVQDGADDGSLPGQVQASPRTA